MNTRPKHSQRGFTLIELIVSIGLSAIVLGATLSLMGFTQKQWTQGSARKDLTTEMSLAVEKIVREVRANPYAAIAVSAGGDTLKVGDDIRIYKDASTSDLVYQASGDQPSFLKGLTTTFKASKPFIDTNGDTLSTAIGVIVAIEDEGLTDSTSIVIVPRAK